MSGQMIMRLHRTRLIDWGSDVLTWLQAQPLLMALRSLQGSLYACRRLHLPGAQGAALKPYKAVRMFTGVLWRRGMEGAPR